MTLVTRKHYGLSLFLFFFLDLYQGLFRNVLVIERMPSVEGCVFGVVVLGNDRVQELFLVGNKVNVVFLLMHVLVEFTVFAILISIVVSLIG